MNIKFTQNTFFLHSSTTALKAYNLCIDKSNVVIYYGEQVGFRVNVGKSKIMLLNYWKRRHRGGGICYIRCIIETSLDVLNIVTQALEEMKVDR